MVSEESSQSPQEQNKPNPVTENGQNAESLFSPRFKSVAAMAGWDEEAILVATLVVEDTPDRESKHKKRSDLRFKTPPSSSRRKRRAQRKSPMSIPVAVLDLDEEETAKDEREKKKIELKEKKTKEEMKIKEEDELSEQKSAVSCPISVLPCMDKLREELSCAICLEICYEPSTTTCGHSFCKKCLRSAADKCGKKCPKCRQLISNGRSCTVNTVLWNTIQLLFPQEVEARKVAGASNNLEADNQNPQKEVHNNVRTRSTRPSMVSNRDLSMRRREIPSQDEDVPLAQRLERENLAQLLSRSNSLQAEQRIYNNGHARASSMRRRRIASQDEDAALARRLERENLARLVSRDASARRRGTRSQDEDATLALRLQREEFMAAFRDTDEQSGRSVSVARANLRAMASRAINNRMRGHPL